MKLHLTIAEPADYIQIAKQSYNLWSSGLRKDMHRHLFESNRYQTWSKRNNYRVVYKKKNEVLVSLKVVRLPLLKAGKQFTILGLAALFTSPGYRGQGLASRLIKEVAKQAKDEQVDGLFLYSAIDRQFYGNKGFVNMGNLDCEINPNIYSLPPNNMQKGAYPAEVCLEIKRAEVLGGGKQPFHFRNFSPWLENDEISGLLRCYNRWLVRQPFGIVRLHDYFTFQLAKHLYVAIYSDYKIPKQVLTILKNNSEITGYAITECNGIDLRLLEIIGDDTSRAYLWQELIRQAQQTGLSRITGFESCVRDFLPSNKLDADLMALKPAIRAAQLSSYPRLWSQPMFLALNNELENLPNCHPCPFLEFDYF